MVVLARRADPPRDRAASVRQPVAGRSWHALRITFLALPLTRDGCEPVGGRNSGAGPASVGGSTEALRVLPLPGLTPSKKPSARRASSFCAPDAGGGANRCWRPAARAQDPRAVPLPSWAVRTQSGSASDAAPRARTGAPPRGRTDSAGAPCGVMRRERLAPGGRRNRGNPRGPCAGRQRRWSHRHAVRRRPTPFRRLRRLVAT